MKKLALIAAALALLSSTSAQAFIGCDGCGGHAYTDQRSGGGGGWGGWFMDGLKGLLDLGSGAKNAPKQGKGNPTKGDFYGGPSDKGLGTRDSPTRGGAWD